MLEASWSLNRPSEQWINVMGTKGGLVQEQDIKVYIGEDEKSLDLDIKADGNNGSVAVSKHFIECCKTGKEPDTSPRERFYFK